MATTKEKASRIIRHDEMVDPRTRTRIVPMEVLALGFSRTGTLSMQNALEILGYGPVSHGDRVVSSILDLEMWSEGLKAKLRSEDTNTQPFGREEFDQLLGQYRAITDAPYCHFGPELMAAYPDAKVILVERDVESWYKSYSETVATIPFRRTLLDRFVSTMNPMVSRRRKASDAMFSSVFRASSTESLLGNLRDVYREHYAEIRKAARPGQILEYKLGTGWGPICDFLGRPTPDVPFPRKNDSAEFAEKIQAVRLHYFIGALKTFGLGLSSVVAGVAAIYWAWGFE